MARAIAQVYNFLMVIVTVWCALTTEHALLRVLAWIVALASMLIIAAMAAMGSERLYVTPRDTEK